MANNRIVRYVTNTALLAVLAAAGIGVYQLGTSGTDVEIQEEAPSYLDDTADTKENEDSAVDAGTSLVEAEMKNEGTDTEKEMTGVENTVLADSEDADQTSVQTVDGNGAAQSAVSTESVSTSASAEAAPKLSFSEDTLMEWPVDGSILLDYNMDQTVYFPTLDQYKLSPAISVQAVEGAPVLASVPMGIVAGCICYGLNIFVKSNFICLIVSIPVAAVVYLFAYLIISKPSESQLRRIPGGSYLIRIAEKLPFWQNN